MNYVSAVYAVVVLIITIDWLFRGRKEYRGQTDRQEAVEEETLRHRPQRRDGASIVAYPA